MTGPTGVGKTHFIEHEWQKKHPNVHFGEQSMLAWAKDKRPGYKTLFIDEANLALNNWSVLEGLFHQPLAIFLEGRYWPLTENHKVLFASNPMSYGGERSNPSFFEHHPIEVLFSPDPFDAIALNDIDEPVKTILKTRGGRLKMTAPLAHRLQTLTMLA